MREAKVSLNEDEMALGEFVANRIMAACLARGAVERDGFRPGDTHRIGAGESPLVKMIQGMRAEIAVCKYLNVWWTGLRGRAAVDCGGVVESRSTWDYEGDLLLKDYDKLDYIHVLVTGTAPHLTLAGWCEPREVCAEEFWKDRWNQDRWGWWIPQGLLRPMEELLALFRRPVFEAEYVEAMRETAHG
jgi:hypothetical protein